MRTYRNSSQNIPINGEKNNGKIITQPNLAPSMRELLQRHALGITDNVIYNANYSGDLPDLRGYEPHDLSTMIYETQEKVKQLEEIKNQQVVEQRKIQYEQKKKRDRETYLRLQKELEKTE